MSKQDGWFTRREGQIIKEARNKNKETQEALAEYMDVDVRTVRNWENGATTPDLRQKRLLVTHLSISPALLGLIAQTNFTLETVQKQLSEAKSFLDNGAFTSACSIGNTLVVNLTRQVDDGEISLMSSLAYALYFLGHATSIVENDPVKALGFYKEMEKVARELQDNNWLCLALTYEGEMYRRQGKHAEAFSAFKSAPQGPDVDILIRSNHAQLLARNYGKTHRRREAIEAMSLARDLACKNEERTSDIYICCNEFSVYAPTPTNGVSH